MCFARDVYEQEKLRQASRAMSLLARHGFSWRSAGQLARGGPWETRVCCHAAMGKGFATPSAQGFQCMHVKDLQCVRCLKTILLRLT